jgi:hypothetical protein
MRQFLKEVRFAIVDGWKSRGTRRTSAQEAALTRTLRESSHVSAGGGPGGGAAGMAPRSPQFDQMVKGADNYAKSFKKKAAG